MINPDDRSNDLIYIPDEDEFSKGVLGHVHKFLNHERDKIGPGEYIEFNLAYKFVPHFVIKYGKVDKE